jgi:transcriptional regulator with XRE-family HTH domain
MDLVLKLRELRRVRGLSQKDVAKKSGVGEKTISSFETGQRIGSLKISQLRKILAVYGISEVEFFSDALDRQLAPWDVQPNAESPTRLVQDLRVLPQPIRENLLAKFRLMIDTASDTHSLERPRPGFRNEQQSEWQMLTSRN